VKNAVPNCKASRNPAKGATLPLMPALVLLLAALLLGPAVGLAQDRPPIAPDRPGVGTDAALVPRGALQIETGFEHARERQAGEPTERRMSGALTLRYGLLDSLELKIDGDPIVALRNGDDATGAGDFEIGVKWRLLDGAEGRGVPTLSLAPGVKLPTARAPIGSERADVTLLGLASWEAGPLTLGLNAGVAAIAQTKPAGYLLQALLVASVSGDVTDRFKVLGEIFYSSRDERASRDLVGATAGVSYLVTRDVAFDAAVITTLAGKGPEYRLQAGASVRFRP